MTKQSALSFFCPRKTKCYLLGQIAKIVQKKVSGQVLKRKMHFVRLNVNKGVASTKV